jgi:hypothetical protein
MKRNCCRSRLASFRDRLTDDDVLEVVGLLMIGKRRFAREHLVEEEFPRLGDVLVDLELLHARLALRLRRKSFRSAATAPSSPELTSQNAVTIRCWFALSVVAMMLSCEAGAGSSSGRRLKRIMAVLTT